MFSISLPSKIMLINPSTGMPFSKEAEVLISLLTSSTVYFSTMGLIWAVIAPIKARKRVPIISHFVRASIRCKLSVDTI